MPDQMIVEPHVPRDASDIAFDSSLFEPLRNAVAAIQAGGDRGITLVGEVRAALADRERHLRNTRNGGQAFPMRKGDLPRGRRGSPKKVPG